MKLSIVIPAYNEEAAIQAGKLAQVGRWLREQPFSSELIVVDDQSQDDTAAMAEAFSDRVIRIAHAGKAAAVIAGIRAARGDLVLFSDMDQATPVHQASKLLGALDCGADVAVGSRGLVRRGAPPGRYLLSWGQAALKFLALGLTITDTQCGFKAFTRRSALDIIEHLVVYAPERLGTVNGPSVTSGFDVEFLFVAQHMGYRVQEIPVEWSYQLTRRVNLLRDARRGMSDLMMIVAARLARRYPSRPS